MKKVIAYIKNHIPLRQVIPLILLTIMFRLAIGELYELFLNLIWIRMAMRVKMHMYRA